MKKKKDERAEMTPLLERQTTVVDDAGDMHQDIMDEDLPKQLHDETTSAPPRNHNL